MLSPFAYALHRRMAGYQTEMLHHFQELLKIPSVRGEGIPGAPFGRKKPRGAGLRSAPLGAIWLDNGQFGWLSWL